MCQAALEKRNVSVQGNVFRLLTIKKPASKEAGFLLYEIYLGNVLFEAVEDFGGEQGLEP